MPLFMDVHETLPDGTTAADVAKAHEADLAKQGEYGAGYGLGLSDDRTLHLGDHRGGMGRNVFGSQYRLQKLLHRGFDVLLG